MRDVQYGASTRQRLDHYLLADHWSRPTVFFLYGGGWRSGRKEDYRFVADTLLLSGCNVIIADYRLYPLVRFDQIKRDAANAFAHACETTPADQPLYIMGHSAGAQLGALLSLDESILQQQHRDRIAGFVGLAGPYDFYPFTDADHWDLFGPENTYPQSQAVNYVRANGPPMYLLHGETDSRVRRGHSKSLMDKQRQAGGIADREVYKGVGHVEIILAFSRIHRSQSKIIQDIRAFLQGAGQNHLEHEIPTNHLKEPVNGA